MMGGRKVRTPKDQVGLAAIRKIRKRQPDRFVLFGQRIAENLDRNGFACRGWVSWPGGSGLLDPVRHAAPRYQLYSRQS